MLYDTYGEEYLDFLQELNEILSINELAELDYMQSKYRLVTQIKQTMANQNPDNAAYLNFIEDLNDILVDFNISKLSYSQIILVVQKMP